MNTSKVKKVLKVKNDINSLKSFKKLIPKSIKEEVLNIVDEKLEEYRNHIKQLKCEHKHTTGKICIGHDSHKDHYENRCLDCNYSLEYETI